MRVRLPRVCSQVSCTRCQSGPSASRHFGGEVLVLRQDVLDRVLVDRHALLAAVVLQAAQPVAAAREVVEVACRELALELLVVREPPVGRQQQEVRLDALQVAVLLQRAAEGGEGLVQRVGRDGADGAPEDVGLDQPHGLERSRPRESRPSA